MTTVSDASCEPRDVPAGWPGDTAMWVFVLGDILIFSSYFIVYMVKRAQAPLAFLESQRHLDLAIGVLNTIVLLGSSWFVARAAEAVRAGETLRAAKLVRLCELAGVTFIAIKIFEWWHKLAQGYSLTSSEFFSFYYFFTGIHIVHVLLGLGILAIVDVRLRAATADARLVETGATYWHMVDLLWVVILALLYMLR